MNRKGQTIQLPKESQQEDKQRTDNTTQKTKHWATQYPWVNPGTPGG